MVISIRMDTEERERQLSEETQSLVREEMREMSNGRRFPEKELMGSSRRMDLTNRRIIWRERGERGQGIG